MKKEIRDRWVAYLRSGEAQSRPDNYTDFGNGGCALCMLAKVATPEIHYALEDTDMGLPYSTDVYSGSIFGTGYMFEGDVRFTDDYAGKLSSTLARQALGATLEELRSVEEFYMSNGDFNKTATYIEEHIPVDGDPEEPAPISTEQLEGYLNKAVQV